MLPALPSPGDALRYASRALAGSRVAFAYQDASMRLHAFDTYGRALRELQKALWDPNAMYQDQTLAAARALVMFEVSPSSPTL